MAKRRANPKLGPTRRIRAASATRRSSATRDAAQPKEALSAQLRALRQRNRTLERARSNYADLFDFSPVTYALLNPAGIILNISMAGCRLLDVERGRAVGHPLLSFVSPEDRRAFLEHLGRSRNTAQTVESELRLVSTSGRAVTCRLFTKAGLYEAALALPTMIVDQTENRSLDQARVVAVRQREAAEHQTALAQAANRTKDRFLATVSHELRTPLAPALIAASRLAAWDAIPDAARQLAATIKRNIELEARLIEDLLDVARVNDDRIDLRLETVDVHRLVSETIRICSPLADLKGITVTTHQIARSHYCRADASRLRQVFWNLLNNAIKFARPRGVVEIRTINAGDDLIRVTVRDDGAGMDEAMLGRLFSPFENKPIRQDSRGGLGLGLAICKGIVRAHGGQIWATSEGVGQGATFGVELTTVSPAEQAAASTPLDEFEAAPPDRSHPAGAHGRARVLLVEDDADSSEMLSIFLSAEGFEVEVAASLEQAKQRLTERWDIVMSDIKLPDGSGLEIARHVQELPQRPSRLIALSGFGTQHDIEASHQAGFDAHLVKPIDLDKLLETFAAVSPR